MNFAVQSDNITNLAETAMLEGISRRMWYYRRKKKKEANTRQEQARKLYVIMVMERIVNKLYASGVCDCTTRAYIYGEISLSVNNLSELIMFCT